MLRTLLPIIFLTLNAFYTIAQQPFLPGEEQGLLDNSHINEASGLAISLSNPGMLWTHNDSGGKPEVFLISNTSKFQRTFTLPDVYNRDWEDIATGPGPEENENYLYVADIGDNFAKYPIKRIYRFKEPLAEQENSNISEFDVITFQFPDGKRDAESLMIDPLTKDIYVVSKREKEVGLYIARYPQPTTDTLTLTKLITLPHSNVVAADISPDGSEILIKEYLKLCTGKENPGRV